jgi:hypothetical protein
MRYFFRRRVPALRRVLLVESGSRSLLDNLLPSLFKTYGDEMHVDLVTCYGGVPEGFRESVGAVYRVGDYNGRARRSQLYRELAANRYDVMGIICSDEPIMTKWKWALAARLRAKVFVLNENGDYFWLDYSHAGTMCHFVLFRAGLTGSGAAATIARLLFFPFTLAYLMMWAAAAHIRRKVRA